MCEAELGDSPLCGFCCLSGPSCWEPQGASWCYFLTLSLRLEKKTPKPSQGGILSAEVLSINIPKFVMTRRCGTKKQTKFWSDSDGGSNGNDPQGHYRASGGRLRDPDSSKRRSYELDQLKSRSRKWNRWKYLVTTLGSLSAFQFHMHFS